jgi:MipA family protein
MVLFSGICLSARKLVQIGAERAKYSQHPYASIRQAAPMRMLLLLSLSCCALAAAAEGVVPPPPSRWEFGLVGGAGTQPAYPGADGSTRGARLLPYVVYRGDRLRVDRGGITVRALRGPTFELDVGTSGALGSDASDVKARAGMPDIGDLVELGPRLVWHLGKGLGDGTWRLELPLRGVFDLGDDLAYRGLSFEPELQFSSGSRGGWHWSASLSAIVGSERYADLYYEVDPAYATATRPAYDGRAGLIAWRLGTSASHWLAPDWRVFVFARIDSVAGAANRASPLVSRRSGAGAGLGVQWVFFRSAQRAAD